MDRKILKTGFLAALAVLLFISGFSVGRFVKKSAAYESAPASQAVNAEDISEDPYGGAVLTVPGTTPRMLSASYWQTGDTSLIFTPEEIEEFGVNNPLYILYYSRERGRNVKLFVNDIPETLDRYIVEELIGAEGLRARAEEPEAEELRTELPEAEKPKTEETGEEEQNARYYVNGEPAGPSYWEGLADLCGADAIPESVSPVYAVAVRRTQAYMAPTDDFVSSDPDEIFISDMICAEIMPFTGAAILHESADGRWYFVISGSITGWVPKEDLARCRDKEEWLAATEPEDFLVVTGCEIVLEETAVPSRTSGLVLPMGTRMKLSKDTESPINGRSLLAAYAAEIPVRDDDGSLGWERTAVPVYQDVSRGWLPMTSDSVIEQAFKFLGKTYGWGGTLSSNDCSGYARQVYACYGFNLPRNSLAIGVMSDLGSTKCNNMTSARKKSMLEKTAPGQLLYMDGHLMIYLGTDGGEPYVISSCATFIDPGNEDLEIRSAYSVFVSNLELLRATGKTWLQSLFYLQRKDY
ncbi:MAG: SH3 domain-containing protein [Firmicutes bacterium]|nr:SH3 domain-containing protein [Bacillota bacterium]